MTGWASWARVLSCLLLAFVALKVSGSGITLYSYQDDLGQLIVVDSIERVPLQFREQVRQGFVPSFRSNKPAQSTPPQPAAPGEILVKPAPTQPKRDSQVIVNEPPQEIEVDSGLPAASMAMQRLSQIHLNHERIYLAARNQGMDFASIAPMHQANDQLLLQLQLPTAMSTAAGRTWLNNAQKLFGQLKSLQFNSGTWLAQKSQELLIAMPPLLTRTKVMLDELKQAFTAIPAGK